jgi:di/tripeptidase
MTLKVSR